MDNFFPKDENNNKFDFLEAPPLTIKDMRIQENMMGGGNNPDNKNKLIEEIAKARPKASWKTYIPDQQYGVVITLPHENFISGTLTDINNSERQIYIDMFNVPDNLQKQGLGTKLLKSLTAEAKYYNATMLNGHITSDSALKTTAKVFDKENLQFYNHVTGKKLDLTYEQALKENPDMNIIVDLNKIDTSNWERPLRDDR